MTQLVQFEYYNFLAGKECTTQPFYNFHTPLGFKYLF